MVKRLALVSFFPREPNVIRGGVEGVTDCLTAGLRNLSNLEIHVIAPCGQLDKQVEYRDGVTIHWIRQSSLPGFIEYWTTFRRAAFRRLLEIHPDIVHFQGLAGWTLGYNGPYVLTIHGIPERDILFSGRAFRYARRQVISVVERLGRKRSSHTILISPYVKNELDKQLVAKCWDIENPVTPEVFQIVKAAEAGRVLYVGRINERKNILGLLRAFASVHARFAGATLRLAGDADDENYMRRCTAFIAERGLSDAVHLLGNISRRSLMTELGAATCLALFAKQETAPLIVEEAMAAALPVVASRVGGLPYLVSEGETGFLVDPEDEQQFADQLLRVLTDLTLATRMGRQARDTANLRFHVSVVAGRTLEVYDAVMN